MKQNPRNKPLTRLKTHPQTSASLPCKTEDLTSAKIILASPQLSGKSRTVRINMQIVDVQSGKLSQKLKAQ